MDSSVAQRKLNWKPLHHFKDGLGDATRVDGVEITWPRSGKNQRYTNIGVDRRYRLIENVADVYFVR